MRGPKTHAQAVRLWDVRRNFARMGESRTGQTPSNVRFDRMRVCGDGVAVAKLECVSTNATPPMCGANHFQQTLHSLSCNECRIQGHEATLPSL